MTIWIRNLPLSGVSDEDLLRIFSAFGTVAHCKQKRYRGEPQGEAYVEMADEGQGAAAISAVHGMKLGGCTLICQAVHENADGRYASPGTLHFSPRFPTR